MFNDDFYEEIIVARFEPKFTTVPPPALRYGAKAKVFSELIGYYIQTKFYLTWFLIFFSKLYVYASIIIFKCYIRLNCMHIKLMLVASFSLSHQSVMFLQPLLCVQDSLVISCCHLYLTRKRQKGKN
jgi:hypothetical protein